MNAAEVNQRLAYLRSLIHDETISYGEILELQGLAAFIPSDDVELLEWAGVPEHPEDEENDVSLEFIADDITTSDQGGGFRVDL